MSDVDELREQVLAVLRGKTKRAEQADALLALLRPEPELIDYVVIPGTRPVLREIEAYGLVIELDAADLAVTVEFPAGAVLPDER
jgi:hypothetical protein